MALPVEILRNRHRTTFALETFAPANHATRLEFFHVSITEREGKCQIINTAPADRFSCHLPFRFLYARSTFTSKKVR